MGGTTIITTTTNMSVSALEAVTARYAGQSSLDARTAAFDENDVPAPNTYRPWLRCMRGIFCCQLSSWVDFYVPGKYTSIPISQESACNLDTFLDEVVSRALDRKLIVP